MARGNAIQFYEQEASEIQVGETRLMGVQEALFDCTRWPAWTGHAARMEGQEISTSFG
jgi:hypothetical protein